MRSYEELLREYPIGMDIKGDMRRMGRERLSRELVGKQSMIGVSVPSLTYIWKLLSYVMLDEYCRIIAEFRMQKAGRGIRDLS